MLLNSFKAMFSYLQTERSKEGDSFVTKAFDNRSNFMSDLVSLKEEISQPALAQHLGLLNNLKSWQHLRKNEIHKCMKQLWPDDKDTKTHPTCLSSSRGEEESASHSHPQFYYNNLGLVHYKLKKYSLAIFYFTKALRQLECSVDKTLSSKN